MAAPKKVDLKAQFEAAAAAAKKTKKKPDNATLLKLYSYLQAGDRRRRDRRAAGRLRFRRRREARRLVQAQRNEQGRGDAELHQAGRRSSTATERSREQGRAAACYFGARFAADFGRAASPRSCRLGAGALRALALLDASSARLGRRRPPCRRCRLDEFVHRLRELVDARREPLHVVLRVDARASTARARRDPRIPAPACPTFRPPFAASPLPSPSRRRAPRPPSRWRPAWSVLQLLALLHQGLEELGALLLRLREGAESGEPDLVRRIEHALRHVLRRTLCRSFAAPASPPPVPLSLFSASCLLLVAHRPARAAPVSSRSTF